MLILSQVAIVPTVIISVVITANKTVSSSHFATNPELLHTRR